MFVDVRPVDGENLACVLLPGADGEVLEALAACALSLRGWGEWVERTFNVTSQSFMEPSPLPDTSWFSCNFHHAIPLPPLPFTLTFSVTTRLSRLI